MKHPRAPEIQECQAFRGAVRRMATLLLALGTAMACSSARRSPIDAPPPALAEVARPAGLEAWSVVAVREGQAEALRWSSEEGLQETPCNLASVSKLFAATIVIDLCRQGALSPDDRIDALLGRPISDPRWADEPILVRHLLTHTSGLSQRDGALVQRTPPGVRYEYSNEAWSLLAEIAVRSSGKSLAELVEARFGPLGIAAGADDGLPPGAGGMQASPDDLERWGRALVAGAMMGPDPAATAMEFGLPDADPPIAACWRATLASDGSIHRLSQSGSARDSGAEASYYPGSGVVVVILARGRYDAEFFREAREAAERACGIGRRRPLGGDATSARQLEGEWHAPLTGERLVVRASGSTKATLLRSGTQIALRRRGESTFIPAESARDPLARAVARESGEDLEVVRRGGRIEGLWWRECWWTRPAP